jgi:hypothetical protein
VRNNSATHAPSAPFSCAGTHPPAATVEQTILPALLESIPQTPEMALAEPKKLYRFDPTQASRTMRTDRIQNARHPNLRQHVGLRSKNRTNHLLPNPDILYARDIMEFMISTGQGVDDNLRQ